MKENENHEENVSYNFRLSSACHGASLITLFAYNNKSNKTH